MSSRFDSYNSTEVCTVCVCVCVCVWVGVQKRLTGWEFADVVGHTDKHSCPLQMISSFNMDLKKE